MDWETLLGFAGLYVLLLGAFIHNFVSARRLLAVNAKIFALEEKIFELSSMQIRMTKTLKLLRIHGIEETIEERERRAQEIKEP